MAEAGTVVGGRSEAGAGALEKVQAKLRELDYHVKSWVARQSPPVEALIVTAAGAFQGGVIGAMMGSLTADVAASMPQPPATAPAEAVNTFKQMQALSAGPWAQAKNFAVLAGVNAGITCVLKRARGGVEDVQTSMAAAFGSGVALTFVSGAAGPNIVQSALSSGLVFALFQGAIFKVSEKFSAGARESKESSYVNTKDMLQALGLERYEKNFKKSLLNDATLPLLNESALQDAKIPPGPRLLILDHIRRSEWSGPSDEELS